jgi:fluoroquinolone transport system permease protein
MRIRNLILGDVKFQYKYGFYFVYAVFTLLYVCLIYAVPSKWKGDASAIMIFSDPAAMGLFFMGAIVLLEKSQRVIDSIAVSPVKVSEYIMSKVLSLGIISTVVGCLIALTAGTANLMITMLGTFLGSILFSLAGLMAAAKITSLNQFLLVTVPIEIVCFLPPMAYMFGYNKTFLLLHPGCIIILLIHGNSINLLPLLILLCLWIGILYYFTYGIIMKMFREAGGMKL